jgi:hypothetical protein
VRLIFRVESRFHVIGLFCTRGGKNERSHVLLPTAMSSSSPVVEWDHYFSMPNKLSSRLSFVYLLHLCRWFDESKGLSASMKDQTTTVGRRATTTTTTTAVLASSLKTFHIW